ncbi:MAG: type II toxin-antitoxin system death-on-curing family toxin [Nitrospirae bacterium]|nr:type II toxin-antitoxin system death-on-curing family toxin [Nitrospirota bacterium]
MKYLTAEQVLFIHSRIIDETGGSHGLRDVGLLESAVSRPKATYGNEDLYPTLSHKAAALMESIVKNHPFLDGNKRTAITSAGIFVQMNGHLLEASQKELVDFTLALATKKAAFEMAVKWFRTHSFSPG